jgi:tetratricopeptide (TPR) repeat protein
MIQLPRSSPVNGQGSKAKVFISYSRKDIAFADRVATALTTRGFEPLIDRAEIYVFEEWWKRIKALIARADTVVFVLSPDAVASDIALQEVSFAASLNKRFAPVVCRSVDDKTVPEAVRKFNFLFFDENARFEQSADQLAEALNTDIGWIRQHTEFGEQARRWALGKRSTGLLLRSPVLEEAERWIASRPTNAPTPTDDTQTFIFKSRRAATRRRNILSASLGTGLAVALALAVLAYWQRGIAIEQQKVANQQRNRAETSLHAATDTSNKLVMDIAVKIRNRLGIPVNLVREILTDARDLLDRISESGEISADLRGGIARALRELATTLLIQSDTDSALEAAEHSRDIMLGLVAEDDSNVQWQKELSLSYNRIGEVLTKKNRRADALMLFYHAFDIRKALADRAPDNAELQRDVAVSYERIGDEFLVSEKIHEAFDPYQNAFKIRTTLNLRNPENREWKRDLSISHEKIGDVQFKSRDFEAAKKSYMTSLAIRQLLAATDAADAEAQRDIAVSHAKIGDVLRAIGDMEQAVAQYRLSLVIRQKLVSADPGNVSWQIDLLVILLELASSDDNSQAWFTLANETARRLDDNQKLSDDLKTWLRVVEDNLVPH